MARPPLASIVLTVAALAGGCGASGGFMEVSSPMTTADELRFDDGVEVVGDIEGLSGRWRDSWNEEIDERIGRADLIAIVTVRTLHQDVDLERRSSYRLIAGIDEVLRGEGDDQLQLSSREGDRGFQTVREVEGRLLGRQFVAFVKWAQPDGEDTPVVARWHLAPNTEGVRDWVRGRIVEQQQERHDD